MVIQAIYLGSRLCIPSAMTKGVMLLLLFPAGHPGNSQHHCRQCSAQEGDTAQQLHKAHGLCVLSVGFRDDAFLGLVV